MQSAVHLCSRLLWCKERRHGITERYTFTMISTIYLVFSDDFGDFLSRYWRLVMEKMFALWARRFWIYDSVCAVPICCNHILTAKKLGIFQWFWWFAFKVLTLSREEKMFALWARKIVCLRQHHSRIIMQCRGTVLPLFVAPCRKKRIHKTICLQ